MRTVLVVLSRGQAVYAPRIAKAVAEQTVVPDRVISLLDRPSDEEVADTREAYSSIPGFELVTCGEPDTVYRPPMVKDSPVFAAGSCRNRVLGTLADYDLAVFIDGDCIPMAGLMESHLKAYREGAVTVGRRRDIYWKLCDQRQCSPNHPIPIFGKEPMEVTNEAFFVDSGVVWTCNVGFTPGAVQKIIELNTMIYGIGCVFHPYFTGRWGAEDGFLGLECFYGGIPVISAPAGDSDGIDHMQHLRSQQKYAHDSFVNYLEVRRKELLFLMHAAGYDVVPYVSREIILGEGAKWRLT